LKTETKVKSNKSKKIKQKSDVFGFSPAAKYVSVFVPIKIKTPKQILQSPKLQNHHRHQPPTNERAYAEGFGPDPKLARFLNTPVPPKVVGIFSLLAAACFIVVSAVSLFAPLYFKQPAQVIDKRGAKSDNSAQVTIVEKESMFFQIEAWITENIITVCLSVLLLLLLVSLFFINMHGKKAVLPKVPRSRSKA
jgi:hypothetical protein